MTFMGCNMTEFLEYADQVIAFFLGLALCLMAVRFIKRTGETGAKYWENVGFQLFQVGLFFCIAEAFLMVSFTFNTELADGVASFIGFSCWAAAAYFCLQMAYDLSNKVEEMFL